MLEASDRVDMLIIELVNVQQNYSMLLSPFDLLRSLPTRGLGLNTISKPLTSRAQFSCRRAAHGTVSEIVWMNPAITSKGASAVSSSSFSDWRTKNNAEASLI